MTLMFFEAGFLLLLLVMGYYLLPAKKAGGYNCYNILFLILFAVKNW